MKLSKILATICPILAIPSIALPITSCAIQPDHSDEVIIFTNNSETSISVQITKDSQEEEKIFFKVKQPESSEQKFTIKWTLLKGNQDQLTVDLGGSGQYSYISIKPNKSIIGEGNGFFHIIGAFKNKYGQSVEAEATCYYTVNITA